MTAGVDVYLPAMAAASSLRVVPSASSERTSKSSDTDPAGRTFKRCWTCCAKLARVSGDTLTSSHAFFPRESSHLSETDSIVFSETYFCGAAKIFGRWHTGVVLMPRHAVVNALAVGRRAFDASAGCLTALLVRRLWLRNGCRHFLNHFAAVRHVLSRFPSTVLLRRWA
jgi:hypothetical protein